MHCQYGKAVAQHRGNRVSIVESEVLQTAVKSGWMVQLSKVGSASSFWEASLLQNGTEWKASLPQMSHQQYYDATSVTLDLSKQVI